MNHLTLLLLFFVICTFCAAENAKLTVKLMNSGFHRLVNTMWVISFCVCLFHDALTPDRDLEYAVVYPDYQGKQHTFLIKQPLPASVYVNTDDLDDLRRLNKVNTYPKSFIGYSINLNHFYVCRLL